MTAGSRDAAPRHSRHTASQKIFCKRTGTDDEGANAALRDESRAGRRELFRPMVEPRGEARDKALSRSHSHDSLLSIRNSDKKRLNAQRKFLSVGVVKRLLYQIYVESLAVSYEGATSSYSFTQDSYRVGEKRRTKGGKCQN